MKKNFKKLIALLVALTIGVFSSTSVGGFVSYAQEEVKVEHSAGFKIEYVDEEEDIKLVTDGEGRNLLLVPKEAEIPEGYDDATVIRTPVENVLFASATQVGLVRPLGVWDSVGGVTLPEDEWYIDEVKSGLAEGSIRFVDGGGYGEQPNYEEIQDLNPDITFVYTGSAPQIELINMLEELDLPYAVDNEYMEGHFLGRLEWVKFLGAFFNKDAEAEEFYNSQVSKADEVSEKVAGLSPVKVAWGQVYDGQVYVPGEESYVAEMVKAAGGELVTKAPGESSIQVSLEDFYTNLQEADVWIVPTTSEFLADYQALLDTAEIVSDAPVVQDKAVWQYVESYFQDTDKSADHVVDLAAIFHPDEFSGHEFVGFQKLAE